MNWMKQSKFEAILLVVVVIAAAGIIFMGLSQGKAYKAAKERFDDAESEVSAMESGKPYPNPKMVGLRKDEVEAFRKEVVGLQGDLLKFRPAELEKISPAEFNTRLTETSDKLRSLYEKSEIVFPEDWRAGFESYTASPPKDAATPYLNFQLQALDALYTDLAKSGPSELLNVHRGKLPVERGDPMDEVDRRGRPIKGGKPFYVLPVEITFRGREKAVRKFLSEVAGAEEYFTSIRSLRIRNSKNAAPPRTSDAEFEGGLETGEDEPADPFGAFDFGAFGEEDEEGEEEDEVVEEDKEDAGGDQILGQVLGAEELNVFLQLELLLFKSDVELPKAGK